MSDVVLVIHTNFNNHFCTTYAGTKLYIYIHFMKPLKQKYFELQIYHRMLKTNINVGHAGTIGNAVVLGGWVILHISKKLCNARKRQLEMRKSLCLKKDQRASIRSVCRPRFMANSWGGRTKPSELFYAKLCHTFHCSKWNAGFCLYTRSSAYFLIPSYPHINSHTDQRCFLNSK